MSRFPLSSVLLVLVLQNGFASPGPGLILERVQPITNPGAFDFNDTVHGDLRSMDRCTLPDGTRIAAHRDYSAWTDTITIGDRKPPLVIQGAGNWNRITLDCDRTQNRFFYGNPSTGAVTAYSAAGDTVWEAQVAPFSRITPEEARPDVDVTGKHTLTALQVRGSQILVEWAEFYLGQRFAVYTTDGKLVESFGPVHLLLRTGADRDDWELIWGTGRTLADFIPEALYRLRRVEAPLLSLRPEKVVAQLNAQTRGPAMRRAVRLSTTPLLDHAVALLWSPTATETTRLDFCGGTNPDQARAWLGRDYDPDVAKQAKNLLAAVWVKISADLNRQGVTPPKEPFNWLIEDRGRANPRLSKLLAEFEPMNAAWDSQFRPLALEVLTAYPGVKELAQGFKPEPSKTKPAETIKVFRADKPRAP